MKWTRLLPAVLKGFIVTFLMATMLSVAVMVIGPEFSHPHASSPFGPAASIAIGITIWVGSLALGILEGIWVWRRSGSD